MGTLLKTTRGASEAVSNNQSLTTEGRMWEISAGINATSKHRHSRKWA